MSDKPDKKPAAAPAAAAPAADSKESGKKAGGGLLSKTPVLMGAVMLLEAVVLIAGFKFLGGGAKPAAAATESPEGAEGGTKDEHGENVKPKDKKKTVELQLLEFRATNKVSGRTLLFDVNIFVVVKGEREESVKQTVTDRKALITDRVRTIIAQSDPEKLGGGVEPGLETLRRQVKYQLDEIIGEGMIEEVLVPRCIPFRADL
jgi:flagellar basal body-associated protein FliL